MSNRRIDRLFLVLLLGLAVFYAAFHRRVEFYHWDTAYYTGVAESLLRHGEYRFNFQPHFVYPPGMPLMLAALMAVSGSSYTLLIVSMAMFGVLGLAFAYFLLRRTDGVCTAASACLLCAVSLPFFHANTVQIGSDTAYFAVTMSLLWMASGLDRMASTERTGLRIAAVAALAVFAVLIRPVGITVAMGGLLWLAATACCDRAALKRRAVRFGPMIALSFIALAAWMIYVGRVEELDWPGQYLHSHLRALSMRDFYRPELGRVESLWEYVVRMQRNAAAEAWTFAGYLTHIWLDPVGHSPVSVAVLALFTAGAGASLRRRGGTLMEWYVLSYLGLLLLWSAPALFDRYMMPVAVLAFCLMARGGRTLLDAVRRNPRNALMWATALCGFMTLYAGWWWWSISFAGGKQVKAATLFWPVALIALALLWKRSPDAPFGNRSAPAAAKTAGLALLVLAVAHGLAGEVRMGYINLDPGTRSSRDDEVEAARWFARNTPAAAVVMAEQDPIVHRYSGRKTITFPLSGDPELIMRIIRQRHVGYLLVLDARKDFTFQPPQPQRLAALEARYPGAMRLILKTPYYRIFEIPGDGRSAGPGAVN